MTDLSDVFSPAELFEINRRGNHIGCVWLAAHQYAADPGPIRQLTLIRTLARAAKAGVDEDTLQHTTQLGKEAAHGT